jgi:hypothetical protein
MHGRLGSVLLRLAGVEAFDVAAAAQLGPGSEQGGGTGGHAEADGFA